MHLPLACQYGVLQNQTSDHGHMNYTHNLGCCFKKNTKSPFLHLMGAYDPSERTMVYIGLQHGSCAGETMDGQASEVLRGCTSWKATEPTGPCHPPGVRCGVFLGNLYLAKHKNSMGGNLPDLTDPTKMVHDFYDLLCGSIKNLHDLPTILPETNITPKNDGFQLEFPFPGGYFQVP